jgi:hypothetical protein
MLGYLGAAAALGASLALVASGNAPVMGGVEESALGATTAGGFISGVLAAGAA